MASLASEFKSEARCKSGEVIARKVGGWSFCLSYGAVNPHIAARTARQEHIRTMVPGRGDVTREVLRKLDATTPEQIAEAEAEQAGEWMLSAKLYPPGRPSTGKDWEFLGEFIGAIGVPTDEVGRAAERIEKALATDTLYWSWRDG